MEDILKNHYTDIIIVMFYLVEIITVSIVLWETISNKSIVDVIWDIIFKEDDSSDQ